MSRKIGSSIAVAAAAEEGVVVVSLWTVNTKTRKNSSAFTSNNT